MKRLMYGCLIIVLLGIIVLLALVTCRAREHPSPPTPTPGGWSTLPPQSPVYTSPSPSPVGSATPPAGFAVTSVTESISPSSFTGACPKTVNFSGVITTNGPGTVTYRWERSDQIVSPYLNQTFTAASSQTVTSPDWALDHSANYFMALHILAPNEMWAKAQFTLTCSGGAPPGSITPVTGQPDLIIADATVTPTSNPNEVRIHIVARNQGPGIITAAFTIRWLPHQADRGVVGCSQDFYNLNQSEWVVDCAWTYPPGERGEMHWVAVVDADNDVKNESNENNNEQTGTVTVTGGGGQPPAAFAVTSVTASVDPPSFMGACPKRFNVSGVITVNGSGTVTYRWERSDGDAYPTRSIAFNAAGSQTVSDYWELSLTGTYWMRLHVLTPNNTTSNQATFRLSCGVTPAPPPLPPVGQPPPAPTNCRAVPVETRSVRIEWNFTGSADGFRIYQGTTSLEATAGSSARSWTISNLRPYTQYHFDVRAYNADGESRADACSVDVMR